MVLRFLATTLGDQPGQAVSLERATQLITKAAEQLESFVILLVEGIASDGTFVDAPSGGPIKSN